MQHSITHSHGKSLLTNTAAVHRAHQDVMAPVGKAPVYQWEPKTVTIHSQTPDSFSFLFVCFFNPKLKQTETYIQTYVQQLDTRTHSHTLQ